MTHYSSIYCPSNVSYEEMSIFVMRLPSLAAILDSEKAKPLASSHPGKISSVPQELLKNAKK